MEIPQTINDIDGDYVMTYCKEQGQEGVDWLKEIYSRSKRPDKNGVLREISFIEVRNEFARKYFPHLVQKRKQRKKLSRINLKTFNS